MYLMNKDDYSYIFLADALDLIDQIPNNTIQTLRLEGNKISDLTSLGEALKVNTTLCGLSIWGNQISNIDPVADAYSLRNAPTVSALADEYLSKHAVPKKRPKSVKNDRSMLDRFVLPRLAKLAAT